MRRTTILTFCFSSQRSFICNFADMDVNMDRVIQLRTGDSNPKVILNITAYPAPESYEWWSDGHRHVSLKHRVLSSTRNFHQVALQLGVVNHSLVGNHNHSLRIKHRVGHRVIPVVFRDGGWEDDNDINSAGKFNQILLIWESKIWKINFSFSCRLISVTKQNNSEVLSLNCWQRDRRNKTKDILRKNFPSMTQSTHKIKFITAYHVHASQLWNMCTHEAIINNSISKRQIFILFLFFRKRNSVDHDSCCCRTGDVPDNYDYCGRGVAKENSIPKKVNLFWEISQTTWSLV